MNPLKHAEDTLRLDVLKRLGLAAATPGLGGGFDALLACALDVTGCPVAGFAWHGPGPQRFIALEGIAQDAALLADFSSEALAGGQRLEVEDAAAQPGLARHPAVRGDTALRFFAGEPLRHGGVLLGGLCVLDGTPRRLDAGQRQGLRQLAVVALELLSARDRLLTLDAERNRLQDFARASGDWLWEADTEGRITWTAGAAEAVTGQPAQALIGQMIGDGPLLDIDGQPLSPPLRLGDLLARGQPFARALTEESTPLGPLVVSRSAVPCFDVHGRIAGWRGSARDLGAVVRQARESRTREARLREVNADVRERTAIEAALGASEERWSLAADAAGIGLLNIDLAGRALRLDRQAGSHHGLADPTGPLSLDVWESQIVEDDRASTLQALRRAEADGSRLQTRYRFRLADGSVRGLELVARGRTGADGRSGELVGICRDVTAEVEAEHWRLGRAEAERASRARSELLSRVSHELRTPLNGILGFAQLMALDREAPLAPAQQRRLDGVQRAGRHLLGLVNDVLDLSRIERGDLSLNVRSVDLVRALDIGLVLVQPLAALHGVALPASLPPAPCWVQADPRALEQVLINLLSNAIQYNRPQGRVAVTIERVASQVAISVRDEGPGLSKSQLGRLFQPFDRLGAERQRNKGSGLGLAIALELTHAMQGGLTATSKPGEGSCFRLELKRGQGVGIESVPGPLNSAPMPLAPERETYRVLYIEDEPLNALLMEEVFRGQAGWQLEVARDGESGIAAVRELKPHIVLVDMNLPDMTGLEIIRHLRADPATRQQHCVVLSADAMPEQMQTARAAGFDDYWTKPIDVARMLDVVEQAITARPQQA